MATKKTSSKFDHITSKVLLHSGSPAVYQLKPKRENIGTLTKMTLGEKNPNKPNKTILLVGETGTGKSTLINTLVNYTMGVKWEDDVWFQIVEDEKRSQTESQTSDVIVYQIFGFEDKTLPYSLTIIDTPGYGDTRGTKEDAFVGQRLLDWFRSDDGVHEMNAVGLVLKATENRVSDRLRYIFDSVMSLFGKDMEEKIVALITHSDGLTPKNVLRALEAANIKIPKDEDNEPVHFLFNNCQNTERTKKNKMTLNNIWNSAMGQICQLTDFLLKRPPQNLKKTTEVLNSRIRLTACIQNLKERIEWTEEKQREIQQVQGALEKFKEEMKNNENFTVEIDQPYKEKVKISGGKWGWGLFYEGATRCTVCEENCHYPGCTWAWTPESCKVMKGGRCTSCTGKCHVSDHVKEEWIYVTRMRKVQMTKDDMKKKYEQNRAECEGMSSLLENLKKKMEELKKEKVQLLDESFQHVLKLEQIALNVNSASIHAHLDFLIDKMKERGDREKVQKLVEIKSRVEKDKGIMEALWYGFGKAVGLKKN